MRRATLAVITLLAAAPGLAADPPAPAAEADAMMGWMPPRVKTEKADRKQIAALFQALEAAGTKGDLDAAASLIDFPVLMVTDDSKGEALGDSWSRERWMQVMAPFYRNPSPDVKVKHRPVIFVITDSLASVDDDQTMTMGKRTVKSRSSMLVVRRGGQWLVKAMVEGGWGDAMAGGPAPESAAAPASGSPR